MQPNTLTLAVDVLNNGTPVNVTYSRFEEYQNRSVYVDAAHTMAQKSTLSLYRTFPKQSGNFRGVTKSSIKFSRDFNVSGVDGTSTIVSPFIAEVSFSIPLGVTDAEILEIRQRIIALLDTDSIMTPLNSMLMI